jgi:cobalt/nickel transport system permease protein
MLTLMATTHFSEVVQAGAALRLPPILLAILDMTYRYLFIMHEEAIRMLRARDSRCAAIPGYRHGQTLRWRARITGQMIATLVIRAYERSERVYAAMLARGYTGHPLRTTHPPLRGSEYALLGGGFVVFASILVIAYT